MKNFRCPIICYVPHSKCFIWMEAGMSNLERRGWMGRIGPRSIVVLVGEGVTEAEREELRSRLEGGADGLRIFGPVAEYSAVKPQDDSHHSTSSGGDPP
jgi:hypothetical protein